MQVEVKQEKECTYCSHIKSLDEFSPDKRAKDGRASICKECRTKKAQEIFKLQGRVGETIRVWFGDKGYEEGILAEVYPKFIVLRDVISTNFEIEEIQVNVQSISRVWFGYTDTRQKKKVSAWGS